MAPGARVGTVIENKYRLDEQIGHGGMGAVYRGTQLAVDRPVAIKLLHPNYVGHKKLQARFEVEARAIARLNHPNCITLFDFGYSDVTGAFYTIVEFIDGVPLHEIISRNTPVKRVLEIIRQIASALGHAHHHGILHRDLKPENIMLARMTDGSEMVKVLDFGIAQIMKTTSGEGEDDDFEADRLTRVGEVFGTPPYMSPEQAQSSRDLTPAADIYSLGIIFYELLEGRLPFLADSPMEIIGMHLNDPPPPMVRVGLSEPIKDVVLQMLEKDPGRRPQTGASIIELLDALPAGALVENSSGVKLPGSEARKVEPTLLLPPETGADATNERNIRTEIDPSVLAPSGKANRSALQERENQALAAQDIASRPPGAAASGTAKKRVVESTDSLQIPDDLSPPTSRVFEEPAELVEAKKKKASTGLYLFVFLLLFLFLGGGYWFVILGGPEVGSLAEKVGEVYSSARDEAGERGSDEEGDQRDESPAETGELIEAEIREISIGDDSPREDETAASDDEEEPEASADPTSLNGVDGAPPPPTRPATQQRAREEQSGQIERQPPPRTTRPRRPPSLDTSGSVREEVGEEEGVRRPVRMGLDDL